MGKTVQDSKKTEWKGLDRISIIVHEELGHIWREISKDDFGIDGEIEIVTPKPDGKGSETNGQFLKVQAKSGKKYVVQDSNDSFASPVEKKDLDYWHKCNVPVLYIVYHPDDDVLYYREVKQFIHETPNAFQRPYKILFDKNKHRFGKDSRSQIAALAKEGAPRISFDDKERLFTNLLPILSLPRYLYHAKTKKKNWDRIREETRGVPPGCIVNGQIYCLTDPTHELSVLRKYCTSKVDTTPVREWINDKDRNNDFVYLLNQLLGKHLSRCGLRYSPEFRRNYFPRENDNDFSFVRSWVSPRTKVPDERTVVKWYEYGKDRFWRHLAAKISLRQYGDDWSLQILPKYFFTTDGETACDPELVGPYTTSLKADEHNSQVMNHVMFWAYTLADGADQISIMLFGKRLMKIRTLPSFLIAPFAIPDDPATYEEKAPPMQRTLFDMESEEDIDEVDDEGL